MSSSLLDELPERLQRGWSIKTASIWTPENPAKGQCSVTAIVVQRLAGGEILKTDSPAGPHFYNRVNGVRYDFTASQFPEPLFYADKPSDAAEALTDTTQAQVDALLRAVAVQK